MRKKFNVALRPLDGREGQVPNGKIKRFCKGYEVLKHLFMHGRVADNTLFADLVLPRFKLRLNEAQHLPCGLQKRLYDRKNQAERDKRYVDDRQVKRLAQILRCNIADVRPLHDDDARVVADFPRQLAIAHVDGKDLACPLLEQAVGKPARGRAGVAANVASGGYTKVAEGFFKLQSAPADIRARAAAHLNVCGYVNLHAGLIRFLAVYIDLARHNRSLRLCAGLGKAETYQQHIQPLLMLHDIPPGFCPRAHSRSGRSIHTDPASRRDR